MGIFLSPVGLIEQNLPIFTRRASLSRVTTCTFRFPRSEGKIETSDHELGENSGDGGGLVRLQRAKAKRGEAVVHARSLVATEVSPVAGVFEARKLRRHARRT